MTTKPLVSIIVPFFNAAPFFSEAIESVRAQTYDAWELLLVDDGSSDGSTEIAQRYAGRYPEKIRYLSHEGRQNRGKSTTRNLGLGQAQGDYVTFLDADDLFLPDKLARQVGLLHAQPTAGMVYGRTEISVPLAGRTVWEVAKLSESIRGDPTTALCAARLVDTLFTGYRRRPLYLQSVGATCAGYTGRHVR